MHYYKDTLDGRFPIAGAEPIADPRFVEITEAEWNVLRQAGPADDHPFSPHVINHEAMEEAARDHIPPDGTRLPDSPPPEHPLPEGPIQAVIHEEG